MTLRTRRVSTSVDRLPIHQQGRQQRRCSSGLPGRWRAAHRGFYTSPGFSSVLLAVGALGLLSAKSQEPVSRAGACAGLEAGRSAQDDGSSRVRTLLGRPADFARRGAVALLQREDHGRHLDSQTRQVRHLDLAASRTTRNITGQARDTAAVASSSDSARRVSATATKASTTAGSKWLPLPRRMRAIVSACDRELSYSRLVWAAS